MPDAAEEAADRLYGLPLEDFVRERDAAAKELRREDRDAAAAVAALRKPIAHAWAANQALRADPGLGEELLEAGEDLRAAQDSALAGGGRDELRAATARERAAVEAIVEAAGDQRSLGPTTLDRLRRTLHAAATDEEVRAAVAGARLTGDAEAGGAWPFALGGDAAAAKPRRAAPKKPPKRDEAREARRREEEEREQERRRELRERLEAARHDRGEAERRLARAEREAARAAERLERALAEAEGARERAEVTAAEREEAKGVVDHARDEVARLEEQLD